MGGQQAHGATITTTDVCPAHLKDTNLQRAGLLSFMERKGRAFPVRCLPVAPGEETLVLSPVEGVRRKGREGKPSVPRARQVWISIPACHSPAVTVGK